MANSEANGQANGLMTLRAYARSRGLAPSSVAKAIASGRISRRRDGFILAEQADREWAMFTRPHMRMSGGRVTDHEGAGIVSRARAAREAFTAKLLGLEFERRETSLVRADEVREAAGVSAARARDIILRMQARVAPALGPAARSALAEEIARVLAELPAPGAGGGS